MKSLWSNQNGLENRSSIHRNGEDSGHYVMTKMSNNQQHSPAKKMKRFRSAFTTDQVHYLEKQFKKFPYIGNTHRREVALALHIPERAVKIWFQNRRMKEKKESVTKERDDDQHIRKPIENQLNNVTLQSVNDQRSLPLLEEIKKPIVSKKNQINTACNINAKTIKIRLSETKECENTIQNSHYPTAVKDSALENDASTEFSIDLCTKYKSELIKKSVFGEVLKENMKPNLEPKPQTQTLTDEQLFPVDLSLSKQSNIPLISQVSTHDPSRSEISTDSGNTPEYLSVIPTVSPLYAQSYIDPNGILWKPINVMPIVSTNSSVLSTNPLELVPGPINGQRRQCNCDCHMTFPISMALQQNASNPQYIITAVPYQTPSSKFS